jgi:hypothetical protein
MVREFILRELILRFLITYGFAKNPGFQENLSGNVLPGFLLGTGHF